MGNQKHKEMGNILFQRIGRKNKGINLPHGGNNKAGERSNVRDTKSKSLKEQIDENNIKVVGVWDIVTEAVKQPNFTCRRQCSVMFDKKV